MIYTTNAIESVNMRLRKITKNRGSFPSDEALLKLFYLALINISKKWTMPIRDWKAALNRFNIQFEDRMRGYQVFCVQGPRRLFHGAARRSLIKSKGVRRGGKVGLHFTALLS